MQKLTYLVLFFIVIASISCFQQNNTTNIEQFSINPEHTETNTLSKLIDGKLKYIRLNSSNDHLIGEIDKIVEFEDKYYILDTWKSKSLFCFNNKGEIIFHLQSSNTGKAPGEFLRPDDFIIVKQNEKNIFLVFSNIDQKYMKFDMEGNFIDEEKVSVIFRKFEKKNDGYFLFTQEPLAADIEQYKKETGKKIIKRGDISRTNIINYNILTTSDSFTNIKGYLPLNENIDGANMRKPFSKLDEDLYVTYGFNDTIYSISKDMKVEAKYFIDFGNYRIPEKAFQRRDGGYEYIDNAKRKYASHIDNLVITSKFLSFSYRTSGKDVFTICSKTTKHSVNVLNIENDIDGGIIGRIISKTKNEEFICVIEPYILLAHLKNMKTEKKSEKLLELTEKLTDFNSNPILMIIKFKEF